MTTEPSQPVERPAPAERATRTRNGDGLASFLGVFFRVCALVFVVFAVIVALAILFTLTPANPDNAIVSHCLDYDRTIAGPLQDLLTIKDPDKRVYANYSVAVLVYLVVAVVFTRLPTAVGPDRVRVSR